MSQLMIHNQLPPLPPLAPLAPLAPLPAPRVAFEIRPATLADVPSIDALQRPVTKMVGWMPLKQLEGHVSKGNVLVAVRGESPESLVPSPELGTAGSATRDPGQGTRDLVGYLIACDRYFKHEDVGIIYQMNVAPSYRRSLVAASLLKAQFDRSAYGVKLYCCWCAQDIEANKFWEAMGFAPLAFRAGSEKKSRTHIFWQKRIRQGDESTPWWFPSQTDGGSLREARIVLPIPPGTHWSDAKPAVLPGIAALQEEAVAQLTAEKPVRAKKVKAPAPAPVVFVEQPLPVRRNGLWFNIPKQGEPLPEELAAQAAKAAAEAAAAEAEKAKPEKKERRPRKNDPRLVAAARELRDRWLEEVNREGSGYALMSEGGKYDVTRAIAGEPSEGMRLLPAA